MLLLFIACFLASNILTSSKVVSGIGKNFPCGVIFSPFKKLLSEA